jgi:hypothetical protein
VTPREANSSAVQLAATRHVSEVVGGHVVSVTVEGRSIMVALEVDQAEHVRRAELGIGAVCSRRLLHALWELPANVTWPRSGLDAVDLLAFSEAERGLVDDDGEVLVRRYQPVGIVRAVGVRRAKLIDAVTQVTAFPGIFSRYAFGSQRTSTDEEAAATASALGVGAAMAASPGLVILSDARPPEVGVPGVYRWWLAETAYDAWLQESAH